MGSGKQGNLGMLSQDCSACSGVGYKKPGYGFGAQPGMGLGMGGPGMVPGMGPGMYGPHHMGGPMYGMHGPASYGGFGPNYGGYGVGPHYWNI